MRELASKLNTSASTVNKLEKGQTQLTVFWMEKLAEVFGVQVRDLLRPTGNTTPGFREDAVPFQPKGDALAEMKLSPSQFFYEVKSEVLDQIGIAQGSILVVDASPEALDGISSGDAVIAQLYDKMRAVTVLRQFIAPSLLITNSSHANAPIINLRSDDASIKGVVVSSHRLYRPGKQAL